MYEYENESTRGFYQRRLSQHSRLNTVTTAAVFIIVGLLFLGRNFGIIDSDLFGILVSWQMLLIVVGVVNLIKRHFFGGVITIAVGAYFLLPEISWVEANGSICSGRYCLFLWES